MSEKIVIIEEKIKEEGLKERVEMKDWEKN